MGERLFIDMTRTPVAAGTSRHPRLPGRRVAARASAALLANSGTLAEAIYVLSPEQPSGAVNELTSTPGSGFFAAAAAARTAQCALCGDVAVYR